MFRWHFNYERIFVREIIYVSRYPYLLSCEEIKEKMDKLNNENNLFT